MPGRLNYTHEDYLNLFIIYGECDKVLSRTCDVFANRYPEKQKPSPNSVKRIFENFKNYGTVKAPMHKRKPIVDDDAIEIAILGYFAAYPMTSLRYVALQTGISKNSIHRILLKHNFHPYSISLVQHLKDTDLPRRVEFCEFILTMFQDDFRFLDNIIWTDEAKFTKNGLFNRHNSHFWCDSNPHATRLRNYQETWQFNVYCAVRNDGVVKLYFYEGNLNDGCFVEGTHYPEGSKVVGIGHSVCDNCYCLRGLLRCEPLSCAPPLLGCAPVVKPGECCAASYNCNGTLEIEPEPNYGLFPTISKEYSKLRKEVQRKPSSKQTHKNNEDVVTVAPFYVLAETLQEPTTKLLYQRSPDTYGTTRHFSGANFKSSSTQKPSSTITENHFFLISSSKQRSSTTTEKPSVVPGVYYATTNYEFQNTNYKRVYSTTLRSNIRSMPTGRLRLSSLMPPEAKDESSNDYLGLGNLNILSIVDSLMDGNLYRRVDSDDKKTSLITESSTTMGTTESTEWTTNNIVDSTTNTLPIDEEFTEESTLSTTTTDMDGGPVTVTTVVKSTDCINGVEQNLQKGSEDIDVSTLLPSDPAEVNNLAEGRTEFISTTVDFSTSESSSTEEINVTDVKSRNISNSKLPPDIEAILNISKHKNGEDFDYDYNEPSLPPSLPNLKIIPFVAADALDAKKESPKDPTPVFIDKKVDVGPLEYTSNMFKPPVETEGGFMPKEPSIMDTFYSNSVPSITSESNEQNNVVSCVSGGQDILHGMPVASESPCMTCTCFYGNVVCQKTDCPPPKPGCKVAVEQGVNLCCPNYVCDKPIIEPLNIPPKIPQEIVTVAEGIVPLDPFKDVIRTEPAPNLQSLIGDMISYQKITSSTPIPSSSEDSIPVTSPHPKLETTSEDANENFSFDKVLQFIFSGTPDIIEKPLSQNPSIPKSESTSTKTENLLPKNSSYNNLTVKVPSYTPSTQKTLLEGSSTTNSYVKIDLIKNSNNNNKTKQNSIGEKLKTKIQNKIKTVEQTNKHSIGVGLLKLAGCNIYGRMYRVGRIISELSGPCLECKCTEVGVQCRQLRCLNGASINNG